MRTIFALILLIFVGITFNVYDDYKTKKQEEMRQQQETQIQNAIKNVELKRKKEQERRKQAEEKIAQNNLVINNAMEAVSSLINGDLQKAYQFVLIDKELSRGFEFEVRALHEGFHKQRLIMKANGLIQTADTRNIKISNRGIHSEDANSKTVIITVENDKIYVKMIRSDDGQWKMSIRSFFDGLARYSAY